jgi:hypothetical protein
MKNVLLLSLILSTMVACTNRTELRKSVFIADADSPGLPQYSEWGYNTFGVYYDREAFISNSREEPIKVVNDNGVTSFIFSGQLGLENSGYQGRASMTIKIADFHPEIYADLMALHNTTLDLSGAVVTLSSFQSTASLEILSGTFQIIRAQHLFVDDTAEEVILSGVFDLQALNQGVPVTLSAGRFDLGVSEYNFFKYE